MAPGTLSDALDVLRSVPRDVAALATVPDAGLLELIGTATELSKLAQTHAALAAGELSRRSAPELGRAGLAQRAGARTVEEYLKSHGVSGAEAVKAVRIGKVAAGEIAHLAPVADGISDGSVSVEAADAIRAGLGEPTIGVEPELLAQAAERLCEEAPSMDPDALRKRARELRDELDLEGVAGREEALRERRSIRRVMLKDGMRQIIWLYDPETAGIVDHVYDQATSPRRGGPHFVDTEQAERAKSVKDDPRTTDQIASDTFAELLRQASALNPKELIGNRQPGIRVIVSADTLESGEGYGVVEGRNEAVSLATVERIACANGTQRLLVDSMGQVLDLGREMRLFSTHQRNVLAARDGGCIWPHCNRPPSWCEAHHIEHWQDFGRTDIADGVLLCRWHHLQLHNERWKITRQDGRYWLEPPPRSGRTRTLLETKSRALREHLQRHPVPVAATG